MEIKTFLEKSNFNFYIPSNCQIDYISFREEGERWSTLRFQCEYKGSTYRFKEFFLDWFYSGFPKSLMSSFTGTYSTVTSKKIGDFIAFTGRDYKGLNAVSLFKNGTQIEIELLAGELIDLSLLQKLVEMKNENIQGKGFHERSFHARTKNWDWFEEKRIAIAEWEPLEFSSFKSSIVSHGKIDDALHIFVFSDRDFSEVFWLDVSDVLYLSEKYYYNMRKEIGIFNVILSMSSTLLAIRAPYGPGLIQKRFENKIITFTSSRYDTLDSLIENYNKCLDFTSEKLDKDLSHIRI